MRQRAQIRLLPDGRRLHLQDGPIDLIVEAFGAPREIESAYRAAGARFITVLDELCGELPHLRQCLFAGTGMAEGISGAENGSGRDALCNAMFHYARWRP